MQVKELKLGAEEINLLVDCAHAVQLAAGERKGLEAITGLLDTPEDYEVLHSLARGGHSEVFVVRSVKTGGIYALKKIQKMHILSDPLVNPVMKERASMISGRNSAWLLGLHKAFQDSGALYFLTDFISGGDLGSLCCRNGTLPEKAIRFFSGEILMALHELHALGMIHRDIKPENVLIDSEGHIKLADFGSSTTLDGADHEVVVGTPDYVAPEVLCMEGKQITEKVDLWSLGVVMYELRFGTTPFYEETVKDTYRRIMSISYTIGECSAEFADIIQKLLAPEERRITVQEAMQHRFFAGFSFTEKSANKPEMLPQTKGDGSIDNFEVDIFTPSLMSAPGPLENIKAFVGFGFDPEISFALPSNGGDKKEVEYIEAKEPKKCLSKIPVEEMGAALPVSATCERCAKSLLSLEPEEMPLPPSAEIEEPTEEQGYSGYKDQPLAASMEIEMDALCAPLPRDFEPQACAEPEAGTEESLSAAGTEEGSLRCANETSFFLDSQADLPDSEPSLGSFTPEHSQALEELLDTVEETLTASVHAVSSVSLSPLQCKIEALTGQMGKIIRQSQEEKEKEEDAIYQSRKLIRKLQTELRDSQSRIEREVEVRVKLSQQKEHFMKENSDLKEQLRRLRLGSCARNFPIKIYTDKRWESGVLYFEENHIRIKDIKLPLNKTYFQNLKKNELLRVSSKGEALSFKLLLPSEEDAYTEHTDSSSDYQISPREEQELRKELAKETLILEGIEKLLTILTNDSGRAQALKQKSGTEKKIFEIKQALDHGVLQVPGEPGSIKYNNHHFKPTTFTMSLQVWCHECNRPLYGLSKQGLLCKGCRMVCHKECHTLVQYSCELYLAMEKGTSIILMAKHLEDKDRIRDILRTGQN